MLDLDPPHELPKTLWPSTTGYIARRMALPTALRISKPSFVSAGRPSGCRSGKITRWYSSPPKLNCFRRSFGASCSVAEEDCFAREARVIPTFKAMILRCKILKSLLVSCGLLVPIVISPSTLLWFASPSWPMDEGGDTYYCNSILHRVGVTLLDDSCNFEYCMKNDFVVGNPGVRVVMGDE